MAQQQNIFGNFFVLETFLDFECFSMMIRLTA